MHGTLLISAILDDSLIIAADSRGSVSENGRVIAFIDSMPKIFPFSNGVVSISGGTLMGEQYSSQVLARFNRDSAKGKSMNDDLHAFKRYIDRAFPLTRNDTSNQFFLGAGYDKGHPLLISFERRTGFAQHQNALRQGLMVNDGRVFQYIVVPRGPRPDAVQVGKLFEKAIKEFAVAGGRTDYVGGPISVAVIRKPGLVDWTQNNFSNHQYASFRKFVQDLASGKIQLTESRPGGRSRAIFLLKGNRNYLKE